MKDEIARLREEVQGARQDAADRHVEADRLAAENDRLRRRYGSAYVVMVMCVGLAVFCSWGWFTTQDRLAASQRLVGLQYTSIATISAQSEIITKLLKETSRKAAKLKTQRDSATAKAEGSEKVMDMLTDGRWASQVLLKPRKEPKNESATD